MRNETLTYMLCVQREPRADESGQGLFSYASVCERVGGRASLRLEVLLYPPTLLAAPGNHVSIFLSCAACSCGKQGDHAFPPLFSARKVTLRTARTHVSIFFSFAPCRRDRDSAHAFPSFLPGPPVDAANSPHTRFDFCLLGRMSTLRAARTRVSIFS